MIGLPGDVERALRAHGHGDRLEQVLASAVISASKKLDSAERFAEWSKRNLQAAPPRERGLAQAQYIAACREVEAARASYERTVASRDHRDTAA